MDQWLSFLPSTTCCRCSQGCDAVRAESQRKEAETRQLTRGMMRTRSMPCRRSSSGVTTTGGPVAGSDGAAAADPAQPAKRSESPPLALACEVPNIRQRTPSPHA